MKRLALAIVATVSVVTIPEALSFQPGERVTVVGSKQTGTVLEDNGKIVKVHLDSSGYSADVGVWYEKEQINSGVSGTTVDSANGGRSGVPGYAGSTASSGANDGSQPGKRVQVGNKTGTILEDTGKLLKIHFDDSGYSADVGVWIEKDKLNDSGSAGGTTAFSGSATPNNVSRPENFAGARVRQNQSTPNYAGNFGASAGAQQAPGSYAGGPGSQVRGNAAQSAPATDKGAGAPPDGIYQCNKISGRSYIHIGTIEIRGGTYKGFSSEQGSFHPFSMDASGGITWTGSLTGLPDGWTLKPAKYVGPDYKGHPLIRIYYSSNRGAAEVIDAVKEK